MNSEGDMSSLPGVDPPETPSGSGRWRDKLDEHLIKEKGETLKLKTTAFYIAGITVLIFYGVFIAFIFWPRTMPARSFLAIAGFLGAVPTVLALAILRYTFAKSENDNDDRKDSPGILASLLSELLDLFKESIKQK